MKKKTIELPAIKLGVMRVTIQGTSDLIINAFGAKVKEEIAATQQHKAKAPRGAKDPVAAFEAAKHLDAEGRACILACALKKAIVACARVDESKKMTELRQAIFVRGERIPIEYEECVMREDPVRLKNGSADLRYRPSYKGWRATFDIEWLANVMSAEQVLSLIQLAGFSVGIHEWRPERNGDFGRFALLSAEPISIPAPEKRQNGAAEAMAS